jgi:hypothetical protein
MKTLVKILVLLVLTLLVFGGGALVALRLLFKQSAPSQGVQPVATPTPDPGLPLLDQGKQHLAKGDKEEGRRALETLVRSYPASAASEEAKQLLGELNIQAFFSAEPGPNKTEYTVVRGDSIARIANRTKSPAELIFKANGLDSLIIQPGQKFVIPAGQFSLAVRSKMPEVTLLNGGVFFKSYKPIETKLPPKVAAGQFKVVEKIAWYDGQRVAFGDKNYLGSSRWITLNRSGWTLYSEPNREKPNVPPPATGIKLAAEDMEELFALVTRDTPVIIE